MKQKYRKMTWKTKNETIRAKKLFRLLQLKKNLQTQGLKRPYKDHKEVSDLLICHGAYHFVVQW